MIRKNLLFWQPKKDYLRVFYHHRHGTLILVFLNYLIWPYLFFVSYSLIKTNANIFWQILIATIIAEIVEKRTKNKIYWKRPLFERKDQLPHGLVSKWYKVGSFPSGHTTKVVFFLWFLLQYQLFNPAYLFVTLPLLIFRVIVGFHYPIDIVGGVIIGSITWLVVSHLQMPPFFNQLIHDIFTFVFYYPLKFKI